jgi:hypothetical protein
MQPRLVRRRDGRLLPRLSFPETRLGGGLERLQGTAPPQEEPVPNGRAFGGPSIRPPRPGAWGRSLPLRRRLKKNRRAAVLAPALGLQDDPFFNALLGLPDECMPSEWRALRA